MMDGGAICYVVNAPHAVLLMSNYKENCEKRFQINNLQVLN